MQHWLGWLMEGNDQIREVAIAAERLGFTGVAISDHVALPRDYNSVHPSGQRQMEHDTHYCDPLITVASMAAVTAILRFMTFVYILPMRDPFTVAKQVASLSVQTDYRFALGVGAGWNVEEIALLGHEPKTRGRRMDEMLSVMQRLWEEGSVEFHGEFFDFDTVGQYPQPERHIPIWVGGTSEAALRRAARHDGWLGMNETSAETDRVLRVLERERGRHLDCHPKKAGYFQTMMVATSDEEYRRLSDLPISGIITWCWPGRRDPKYHSLQAKLDAMTNYADKFIRPSR
jgi:probable F420-dependent oxidoreductase